MAPTPSTPPARDHILGGLGAGALAAVAAALVSLPLRSPNDAFFNTASITLGALLVGLVAGLAWQALHRRPHPLPAFAGWLAAGFALVALATLAFEAAPGAPLDGVATFVLPLAALVFAAVGVLTPLLARPVVRPVWSAPVATVAALALGMALAGQGDAQSGRLALPALPEPPASRGAGGQASGAAGEILRPHDVAGVVFTVVPGESTATYTVREKLARLPLPSNAVGRTTAITGTIRLDGGPSTITVDLRTLESDQPMRDRFIRERGGIQSERYPYAQFSVTQLDLPSEYRVGETVSRAVTGMMKIREVERPLTFQVEARFHDNTLFIVGRTDFTWADFDIPPPNIAGIVQVEDTVHIEVLIVARRDGTG